MHGPTILLVASVMIPILAAPLPAPHINAPASMSITPRDRFFVTDLLHNVLRRASVIEAIPDVDAGKRAIAVNYGGEKRDETLNAEKRGKGVQNGGKRDDALIAEKRGKGIKNGGKRDDALIAEKRGKGIKNGGKRDDALIAEKRGKGVKNGGKRGEGVVRGGKREPSVNDSRR